jgi:hypothetical protein
LQAGERGTPTGQQGTFNGLSGFLQVIMIPKKPGKAINNPFLLGWHGESLAGFMYSLKPQALRVNS